MEDTKTTELPTGTANVSDEFVANQSSTSKRLSIGTNVDAASGDKLLGASADGDIKQLTPKMAMMGDYSAGTFTPEYNFVAEPTYVSQQGNYIKIGNLVFFDLLINVSSIDNADGSFIHITGFPYVCAEIHSISATVNMNQSNILASALDADDNIQPRFINSGIDLVFADMDGIEYEYTDCSTSGTITVCGIYRTS